MEDKYIHMLVYIQPAGKCQTTHRSSQGGVVSRSVRHVRATRRGISASSPPGKGQVRAGRPRQLAEGERAVFSVFLPEDKWQLVPD